MEYSIKSAPIRTVIGETKIEANISGGSISTTIGEGARMNVSQATVNVESGKAEIEKAVNQGKTVISDHTTEKIGEFDSNAVDKTQDFNDNAVDKTQDFNDNASDKTQDFNDNYVDKKALIDAEVSTAQNAAAEAKQWAIGDPTEPTGNSAKYWAEEAATTLANKQDKLTVGTGIDITSNVISVTSPALINTATYPTDSIALITASTNSAHNAVAVGYNSIARDYGGVAIGTHATSYNNGASVGGSAEATGSKAVAVGYSAKAQSSYSIQIGQGTNTEANSLYVGTSSSNNYKMLDDTGLIPDARISSNIARTSALPTNYVTTDTAQTITPQKAFSNPLVVADGVGIATGTILSNKKILQKTSGGVEVGNSTEDILLVGKSATTNPTYNGNDIALVSDIPTDNASLTNGAGYTTNIGTVTSVNGNLPDADGAVTVSGLTVDQVYDGTSSNAQSGTAVAGLLEAIYPVGSVYIGTQATCPMSTVMSGTTWTLVSSGKALWTGDGTNGNTTIAAGLPNITGYFRPRPLVNTGAGAIQSADGNLFKLQQKESGTANGISLASGTAAIDKVTFDASQSNSIYGASNTVQPPAYVVNVWRRTA